MLFGTNDQRPQGTSAQLRPVVWQPSLQIQNESFGMQTLWSETKLIWGAREQFILQLRCGTRVYARPIYICYLYQASTARGGRKRAVDVDRKALSRHGRRPGSTTPPTDRFRRSSIRFRRQLTGRRPGKATRYRRAEESSGIERRCSHRRFVGESSLAAHQRFRDLRQHQSTGSHDIRR